MRPACGCLFYIFHLGLVQVFEIEISHMDKNKRNPDLVSEKNIIFTQQKSKICPLSTAGGLWVGWVEVFIVPLVKQRILNECSSCCRYRGSYMNASLVADVGVTPLPVFTLERL